VAWATVGVVTVLTSSLAFYHNHQMSSLQLQRNLLATEQADLLRQRAADSAVKTAEVAMEEAPAAKEVEASAEYDELALRMGELQMELHQKDQIILALKYQVTNQVPTENYKPQARGDWLEDLKQNDPERYEEIIKRREEARDRMRDGFARKAAELIQRDTSGMTLQEVEEYELMLQVLDEAWLLSERIRADMPQEKRRELRREMRETMHTLSPMMYNERSRQFYMLGIDFGYNENEAVEFVEYLNAIVELTSLRSIWHGNRTNEVWKLRDRSSSP